MSAGSDAAADSLLQLPESVAPEYLEESILDAMEEDGVHPPAPLAPPAPQDMDLVTFLIHRACNDSTLANYFAWYVLVECNQNANNQNAQKEEEETNTMHKLYFAVLRRFSLTLKNSGNPEMKIRCDSIQAQQGFMIKLTEAVKIVARESANRKKKMEKLQAVMRDPDVLKFNFTSFPAIPLPLDPKVTVTGIDADKCYLFKSALMPCRLHFLTTDGNEYVTMYKHGDDLRQDQLIIQMITLMDKLLMGENLDLKLTPYKVLATSPTAGFVQFIESVAVAEVLEKEGTIKAFLRNCGPSDSAPHGINPEIMDNYIRSCAGYSVITYLLGVGDRHFDNLLLTYTGKLFHIDFGYILGRDPKPMPPPMRISREMADAMGGTESEQFTDFRKLCYTAFLALRRNSNLILNLFSLMVDASVPDIALEPDKTVKKVQDKFCLEYSDEEAVQYMETIINHSLDARFAGFFEQVHKLAQYWRK